LEMSLPRAPKGVKVYKITAIALVAIQKNGKWCATHETRGWYMPAGRLDYGEGVETGAKREALEEAGIHVNLTNIVRIELLPGFYTRLRVLYTATPQDENAQLRDISQADHEIVEAKWVEPEELNDGRPVRTNEMITLFRFLNTNPPLVPVSLMDSEDGFPIDHNNVVTSLITSGTVILSNISKSIYYIIKSDYIDSKYDFWHCFTFPTKKWIKNTIFDTFNRKIKLQGVIKVRFLPPHSEHSHRSVAHLNVVYFGTVDLSGADLFKPVHVNDLINNRTEEGDRYLDDYSHNLFLSTLKDETIYPLGVIAKEGSALVPLTK